MPDEEVIKAVNELAYSANEASLLVSLLNHESLVIVDDKGVTTIVRDDEGLTKRHYPSQQARLLNEPDTVTQHTSLLGVLLAGLDLAVSWHH